MGIIKSILDTDLYGLHQGDFLFNKYPHAIGEYAYLCRDGSELRHLRKPFMEQAEELSTLKLTAPERKYLESDTLCSAGYLDHLQSAPVFDYKALDVGSYGNPFSLRYKGDISTKILWEPTLMAIISQLNFEDKYGDRMDEIHEIGLKWAAEQSAYLNANAPEGWSFTEGGTRRRLSATHQRNVLSTLWADAKPYVNGTSNVLLGMELGMPIYGSIAHQLIMFYQTIVGLENCNRQALVDYNKHFGGKLNMGLSDTLGNKKWDIDFTADMMSFCYKERWDSGDAYEWADMRLAALRRELTATTGRTLNFSNDLDFVKAFAIHNRYKGVIDTSYMLGTYITNTLPIPGHKAVSQVIKLMWASADQYKYPLAPTIKTGADVDASKLQCECPRLREFTTAYLANLGGI